MAATLAATVAVGVGVALARAERERRTSRGRRGRDRRFALLAGERLGASLQRIALAQLDIAIELLEGTDRRLSPERRVHEARKALKRLRALLRLIRGELGESAYEREHELLRRAGLRLAQARDAEVLLATLDGLIEREMKRVGSRRGVQRLRAKLQTESDGAAALALADSATHAGVLGDLRAMRVRVSTWQLSQADGIEAVEPALRRLYAQGRRRMRRARRASGNRASERKLHEWRKRVKDLRYTAEMLGRAEADAPKGKRGKLAKRADDLGELLGEEHDLAVLAARVRAEAKASGESDALGRRARKALLKAIARRRKRLRKRALRDGKRLYKRKPKQFIGRMRAADARAALSRR